MDKLKKFKTHRNICISDMTSLNTLAQKAKVDKSQHTLFKVRYLDIESIHEEFLKHHNNVISMLLTDPESDVELENTLRESFLADYYAVKTVFTDLFEVNMPSPSGPSHSSTMFVSSSAQGNARLPKIELMKFSGDYREFASFRDQFDALVHNNAALTPIEKFTYLTNSLQGTALSLVKTLPLTAANYTIAYHSIIDRFSNRRLQSQSLWSEIENASKITSPSADSYRNLLDKFTENVAALKKLNFPTEHWDFILVMMLLKRLDKHTLTRFEMEHDAADVPKFKELIDFINRHCLVLETLDAASSTPTNYKTEKVIKKPMQHTSFNSSHRSTTSLFVNRSPSTTCILCQANHSLYTCPAFAAKSVSDRYTVCKNNKLCFNCLSSAHDLRVCKSSYTCKLCKSRFHHTLLHDDSKTRSSNILASTSSTALADSLTLSISPKKPDCTTFVGAGLVRKSSQVLLSTACIDVLDRHGNYQSFRCLIDSGSMNSFITEKAVQRLKLRKTAFYIEVRGLGSMNTKLSKGRVSISLKSKNIQNQKSLFTDAIIVDKICDNFPDCQIKTDSWTHIQNLSLADPFFYSPGTIDLLLGADVFSEIILPGCITGKSNQPIALNTLLGYILIGKIDSVSQNSTSSFFISSVENSFENDIYRFWEIETVPETVNSGIEDSECEKYFLRTISRASDGKFIVSLPFLDNSTPQFSNMRNFALSRFYSLERRLLKQPQLYAQYKEFMKDYLDSHHMEEVLSNEIETNSYYLIHHCVLKPESLSTKLRVVFDGSATNNSQSSLNDRLMPGPKLQPDICKVILNFRLFQYVICCDIRQMYRMIWVDPDQCNFQRIVFRFAPNNEIQDFRLKTVTYGLRSSPYLALRVLRKLAEDENCNHPHAARLILNNSYVDDFIFGAPTIEDARMIRDDLIALLGKAGFQLRKFCSNNLTLLEDLPDSYLSVNPLDFQKTEELCPLKVLGLNWNPSDDSFKFFCKPLTESSCSKRIMLSQLARVYDPLGFVAPTIFLFKHLIQKLWISKLGWDETPTDDIVRTWQQYKLELPLLSELRIERRIVPPDAFYEIHGFCDASEKGYACVVYLRALGADRITTHFVCAKSKIAPLKKITIPRLELCAAVLLSKLMCFVVDLFRDVISIKKIVSWSDSQIVLHWLNGTPNRWKTFVANRVSYIQSHLPQTCWVYINSENNPADLASRGLLPSKLLSTNIWFTGPSLLREREISIFIPQSSFSYPVEEQRTLNLLTLLSDDNHVLQTLINRFSSFDTLLRVTAYLLRFISNVKDRQRKTYAHLTNSELYTALLMLVKYVQQKHFFREFENKKFSLPLRKLYAFLDSEGILRVGGRIENAHLRHDAKFPILVPRQSRFTTLTIEHYHKKYLHAGPRTTQYLISQRFWILSSKRAINSVISKCVYCWKIRPKSFQPPMAPLPETRITQAKAFLHSAVDFGGPYLITLSRHRGVKSCKAYICVFVCLATKAVHVELASDLSAEIFLAALQRFVARRGRVSTIFCDNATNFVGASKQLKLMKDAAEQERIKFVFSPPSGPHFNGLAEAGIKSVKLHLTKVIGDQILSYEEFNTILTLIESSLNSRPLTPLSSDVDSVDALTPGHFLTLEPPSVVPTPDFSSCSMNRLSRWQLLQRIHQDFWRRWRREYLHTLQQRSKWLDFTSPPRLGSLVLIKEDNLPPGKWSLARIVALHPGDDNVTRVATVKTISGFLKRPLVKLCPLPVE